MSDIRLTVLRSTDTRAGTHMAHRRAMVLVAVHVVILLHIVHYVFVGRTLSPLEPSEAGFTLRDGLVNAGAILLAASLLSTLVLGRWFCGWACHVVAYQDAARWLLIKLGLRPRPVRSRALLLVPLFAAYWLYGRPIVAWFTEGPPSSVGWHLATEDFWGTFPGWTIGIATFLVCGGLAVWVLGAKGFCTYGCPYGALFVQADRAARGRIRVNDDCTQSGACTRACSSNVNVASEVARYGMVVDPGCMKCLDCVASCPNDALAFAFTPKTTRSAVPKKPVRRWDLSIGEELAAIVLFAVAFVATFRVYGVVPLLLAIGVSIIAAYLGVVAIRLPRRRTVVAQRFVLRRRGSLTPAGVISAALTLLAAAGLAHSALIQWHTVTGSRGYERAMAMRVEAGEWRDDADHAEAHLAYVERWGLAALRGGGRMRGELARCGGDADRAVELFDAEMARGSRNPVVPMLRGLAMVELGRGDEGVRAIKASMDGAPVDRYRRLDWELNQLIGLPGHEESWRYGVFRFRLDMLREVLADRPETTDLAVRLCRLLSQGPPDLRDPGEALAVAMAAVDATGLEASGPNLLGMTAHFLAEAGRMDDAVSMAQAAIEAARRLERDDLLGPLTDDLAHYQSQ